MDVLPAADSGSMPGMQNSGGRSSCARQCPAQPPYRWFTRQDLSPRTAQVRAEA